MSKPDPQNLPSNVDAERFVLGSLLLDDSLYIQAAGTLQVDDFSQEAHRRLFRRMGELQERGEHIDRVTLANEIMKFGELESIGGLSYLIALDDGLPQLPNIDSYIVIVKEKAVLRRIIFASRNTMDRALLGEETADDILSGAGETLLQLTDQQAKAGLLSPADILRDYPGGIEAFLNPFQREKGLGSGFTKLDEYTGGVHAGELFIVAGRPASRRWR